MITAGTYAPTDLTPGDVLPVPGPAGPFATTLSVFKAPTPTAPGSCTLPTTPAATWATSAGSRCSSPPRPPVVPTTRVRRASSVPARHDDPGINVSVYGDRAPEATETFVVNLSSAVGAFIADSQSIGTIVDDDNTPTAPLPKGADRVVDRRQHGDARVDAPAFGLTPTGYVLEGDVSPGSVLASLPLGATPMVTFGVPTGSFFVRIHTLAGGQRRARNRAGAPGTYTFTVRGANACGTGAATAPQTVTIP